MATGSDMAWIFSITILFILLGTIMPIIDEDAATYNNGLCGNGIYDPQECAAAGYNNESWLGDVSMPIKIFLSIVSMFFWSFGLIPWWIDMFLIALRVVFFMILIRIMPHVKIGPFEIGGTG